MLISRIAVSMLSLALVGCTLGIACAQDFPKKTIRVLTTTAGGGVDLAARIVAQGLTASLGQPVIVDNRGSQIAVEVVAKAAPDGYTLLYNANVIWLLPFMRDNVSWDPVRDFAPVAWVVSAPNVIVAHPSLPVKSIKELIALAKARPGELNYASGNPGSSNDLAAELFKSMAAVNIVHIAYRGGGPALNELLGGHVQLSFSTVSAVMTQIKSGRLRALAVTSAQPYPQLPGVSTVAAAGLPGYEATSTQGMLAPAGTPPAIVRLLNDEIARVLNKPDVKQKFFDAGAQSMGGSPEQFAATIRSEMEKWGKVIKSAGIRAD